MKTKLFLAIAAACLLLSWTLPSTAQVSISVYPDPVQFGTVALHSPDAAYVYVSNPNANSVTISAMTISGTNSTDFAFNGPNCVFTISANQTCQMSLTFTPSAMTARSATLQITVTGESSTINIPLLGTGGNPIPVITTMSPASIYQSNPATTITINGSGFISSSLAYFGFGSAALPTTFVSSTQLKAVIPASDLTQTGSYFIVVTNPAPAGGTSSTSTLTVVGLDPQIQSISPISVVAGTAPGPITLNGTNFQVGSTVLWNGTAIPTTYLNSGQVQAQPTTAELASAGMAQLSVSNPAPGGLSTPITLNVTYPATLKILDLPANDLVWDPFAQLVYASLPSSYGVNGNSIAVINPTTGVIQAYHFAGSEPTRLALSADGKYLYVGLNGDGSVQRLILPNFTPDINISLGTSSGGIFVATDLQVSPTNSHTIAVALGSVGCCSTGPLVFFTDSTKLANSVTSPNISELAFVSGTLLYGYSNSVVSEVAVTATGGTLTRQLDDLVSGNSFAYAGGLIYGSSGAVLNPTTGLLTGTFDVGTCCSTPQVLPNSTINRLFVLGTTPFFGYLGITSFNLSEFTPVAVTNLSALNGTLTPIFIQWASNGLAFTLQNSECCYPSYTQTILVQSPTMFLTASQASKPLPVQHSLSKTTAVHGGPNFTLTIQGSGFFPGSVATWNGKSLFAQYLSGTQLKLYVPSAKIASAGTAAVVVENSGPGGGKSAPLTFTIK